MGKFDRHQDERVADSAHVADPDKYAPCRTCHGSTPKSMLAQYGTTCRTCFEAYAREGQSTTLGYLGRDEKLAALARMRLLVQPGRPSREWATRLRDRHSAGEKLTPAQVVAYRGVLRLDETRSQPASGHAFDLPPLLPMVPSHELPPVDAYQQDATAT